MDEMYLFGFGKDSHGEIADELSRLTALADDMAKAASGQVRQGFPDDGTPILDRWAIARVAVPCLIGECTGHPVLAGEARPVATSQLWLMSEDMAWARSHSQWYRLGRPAGHQAKPS